MAHIQPTSVGGFTLRPTWLSIMSILFVVAFIILSFFWHLGNEPGEDNAILSIAPQMSITAP
ncbi:hypothetical protein RGR602_PC00222 (plasmid) [Rhizobium gallicum bv. gallicum R602sp]|uniref:Uncharacterized protein n=1 Tax=Rhizobium gallicum bv. gallicum R602sp TaxID=1041138 RepID=A0A0B4XCM6_9HYPH|nr:hypothetical protein RGR602_PC00222 [Rhizobium gallicum bv. gallicum R602sp]